MTHDQPYKKLAGAQNVVDWFGYWPSFHDAEVVSVELHRAGRSFLRVHTFRMTKDLDDRGYYICDKHAIVVFSFKEITSMSLNGFNGQNVLSCISLETSDDTTKVVLGDCFGIEGFIEAQTIDVNIEPGRPDGIYSRSQA